MAYYMTCRAVDQTGLDLFASTIITVVRNGPSRMESSSDKQKNVQLMFVSGAYSLILVKVKDFSWRHMFILDYSSKSENSVRF
jgi:hypothetical protein